MARVLDDPRKSLNCTSPFFAHTYEFHSGWVLPPNRTSCANYRISWKQIGGDWGRKFEPTWRFLSGFSWCFLAGFWPKNYIWLNFWKLAYFLHRFLFRDLRIRKVCISFWKYSVFDYRKIICEVVEWISLEILGSYLPDSATLFFKLIEIRNNMDRRHDM